MLKIGYTLKTSRIAFIGGGNMASSLIGGLLATGVTADDLYVADPDNGQRECLKQRFGVHVDANNTNIVSMADTVILAVKPQIMQAVVTEIGAQVQQQRPLIVSIAAGIRTSDLICWLGGDELAVVRAMPNTPALVGCGACGLYATAAVTVGERDRAAAILGAAGVCFWFASEDDIDTVTALSGSGPAYFLRVMEAMEAAAVKLGMQPDVARALTIQTALGAAQLAEKSTQSPAELRQQVTSKGGTTERALEVFEAGQLDSLVYRAMVAASQRSKELSMQLGGN